MRRRRRILGRAGPPGALADTDGTAVVVFAFVVAAAIAVQTAAVQQGDWQTTSNDSVMHNVSSMIERLLANYDMRLRPQFGGRHSDKQWGIAMGHGWASLGTFAHPTSVTAGLEICKDTKF